MGIKAELHWEAEDVCGIARTHRALRRMMNLKITVSHFKDVIYVLSGVGKKATSAEARSQQSYEGNHHRAMQSPSRDARRISKPTLRARGARKGTTIRIRFTHARRVSSQSDSRRDREDDAGAK